MALAAGTLSYVRPDALDAGEVEALHAVISRSARVSLETFEGALRRADEVFVYRVGDAVRGMGLLNVYRLPVGGRSRTVIFTGKVHLDPEVRGRNIIQQAGARCYVRHLLRRPWEPAYWAFSAGSYKSYMLLPRNFGRYWPAPGRALPATERALLEALMARRGVTGFDADTPVIQGDDYRYDEPLPASDAPIWNDPDAAFYFRLNPRQAEGDVIACLCPLSPANWLSVVTKAIARLTKRRARRPAEAQRAIPAAPLDEATRAPR
jgi:hypothetical protein